MRTITTHQTNECNKAITITADEPSHGNASHHYLVRWHEADGSGCETEINFQEGPIKEFGVNGITNEVLLAILIDRLRGFQSGPYACEENEAALICLGNAKTWLESRTRACEERGVEGTHEV